MNKKIKLAIYLVAALILFTLPKLGLSAYYLRLVNLAQVYVVLALGLNIIVGFAGQMSFAHAAFFAIGAYTAAILSVKYGAAFWMELIAAVFLTVLFAVLVGIPTLKLEGKYLSMSTIGLSEIVRLILLNTPSLSFGADGIRNIPYPQILGLTFNNDFRFYYLLLAFAAATIYFNYRIKNSRKGRAFGAIKENTLGAELMGVPTTFNKVLAFALSAGFTGIGGVLFAHLMAYIHPDIFIFAESAKVLSMVFLGGAGTIIGPIIGAVLLTFLPEFLRGLQDYYMIIYAAAVIVIMLWAPTGLVGVVKSLFTKKKSRKGEDLDAVTPNA